MRFSQSGIQLWSKCPEAYRQRYINKVTSKQSAAASFGTVVHFALETYHSNGRDIDLARRTFEHYWKHPEQMGVAPEYYLPRTSWYQYNNQGIEMLNAYHEGVKWSQDEIIGLEVPFDLPIGEHTLVGFIDILRIKTDKDGNKTLDAGDFKTGKKPTFLRYNVQFTAYQWAVSQAEFWEDKQDWLPKVEGLNITGTWISLKDSAEVDAGPRDEADFHRLEKTVDQLAKSIDGNIFVPTLSGDSCAYCEYWQECGLPDGNLVSEREAAEQAMAEGPVKFLEW